MNKTRRERNVVMYRAWRFLRREADSPGHSKSIKSRSTSVRQQRQAGQSLIEFIVVMPLFFAILFGIFEFTFIYKAKTTLNTATFEAARAGSLQHGRMSAMVDALAKGMTPLYMKGKASAQIAGMTQAYLQSRAVATVIQQLPGVAAVEIISPSPAVVDAFSVQRRIKPVGESEYQMATFIPSDNLYFRSSTDLQVNTEDGQIKMNIQDANILKICTFWCYRMKTPLVSRLIRQVITSPMLTANAEEQMACNAASGLTGGNYMALRSHAVMRMQSHFIKE